MTGDAPVTIDLLAANVITAAEQQTMNYYMNTAALWPEETGRRLYQEIGMVEEQHVTQYGSLLNPGMTWLENLLVHQYVECWLYWSCAKTETDGGIRKVWDCLLEQELLHLDLARRLLRDYEGKEWHQVIPEGEFPRAAAAGKQHRLCAPHPGRDSHPDRRPRGLPGKPRSCPRTAPLPPTRSW